MRRFQIPALAFVAACLAHTHCAAQAIASDDDVLAAIRVVPFEMEFRTTRAAAEAGSVEDQVRVGKFYEQALGVEQNLSEAIVWYRRAAEAGSAAAALALGKVLQNKDLPAGRYEAPEPWLRRAAEGGLADAQVALSQLLWNLGRDRWQESDEWMERAAHQRHPAALIALSGRLSQSKDPAAQARAAQLLSDAGSFDPRLKFWAELLSIGAKGNKADAARSADRIVITDALHQSAMSLDLEQQADVGQHGLVLLFPVMALGGAGDVDLRRADEQVAAARDKLKVAAEAGELQAACNLGFLQLLMKDYVSAFEWYRKAALRGSARAAYRLGVLYRDGLGVRADRSHAATWFYRSAIQMYPPAQAALGDMLLIGTGVTTNTPAAIAWLRPAAAYGNPLAQYNLGLIYDRGLGVQADRERALMLIAKAAVGANFPSVYYGHEKGREGLPAAQDWIKAAEVDPQRGDAVHRAIARAARAGSPADIDSAPIDCSGHERAFPR